MSCPLRVTSARAVQWRLWLRESCESRADQGWTFLDQVTYDIYGHLFPDYDNRTTRYLEDLFDEAGADNVVSFPARRGH